MNRITENLVQIYSAYKEAFSGTILIADSSGIAYTDASGYANCDFCVPNRIDTRFDTASVTKVFTAVATLQLVEKGIINFDTRITDIIDLAGTKIPSDVTIEHLLTHTSGIADDADEEAGEDYAALFINKPNYSIRECNDFLPQFAYKEPMFKAGTNVRYNNCAFILLGLAIEKTNGVSYRKYVTDNIFKRCRMERTCFQSKDDICPDTAEGYYPIYDDKGDFVKWKKNIYAYPPIGTADSGAYTTVTDLYKFWTSIQNDILLTHEYSNMMKLPHCDFIKANRHGTQYFGYAIELIESEGKLFCIYKDGVNSGVAALMSYYPELDIYLNILSNQDGSIWKLNREIRTAIMDAAKFK